MPSPSPEIIRLLSTFAVAFSVPVFAHVVVLACGVITQRGWADKTIERATPCLFGIFSLVVLLAQRLYPEKLPIRSTAWYDKQDAAFSDALAALRLHLWTHQKYQNSTPDLQMQPIPTPIWNALLQAVCYST